MEQEMMQQQAEAGRATDTVLGHLSLGEVVIPRALLDDPEVMGVIQQIFAAYEIDMGEFTVGDPANKINPETGHPEFFFKKLKRIFKKVANVVLPNLGAVGGFTNGLVQGQGLGGALRQGLGSGIQAAGAIYGGPIGGAIAGGANSAINGRDPITGAITGGIGGALTGGSFGDVLKGTQLGDILGSSGPVQGPLQPGATGLGNSGTGISGAIARIGSAIPGASSTQGAVQGAGVGAGSSAYGGSSLGNILGGLVSAGAQNSAAEDQLKQQREAAKSFAPFANPQFTEQDFQADPGYQFRLQEGQRALERSQAARGGLFSGQALRESQELGQGLAGQTFQDSFNRNLALQQQGVNVADRQAGIATNVGNIRAANTLGLNNTFANTLSQALGGGQVNNAGRTLVGYDAQGNPIYR